MSTTVQVCGRWPLELLPGEDGCYSYLEKVCRNVYCMAQLLKTLPRGITVAEYFAGVGVITTSIQEMLRPRLHYASDLSDDCVAQLHHSFDGRPGMIITQGDAKDLMGTHEADLVELDFPWLTRKTHDEWPWAAALARRPRYVIWCDCSLRRLPLHRAFYSRLFGCEIFDLRDYAEAYSRMMWDRHQYSVTRVVHHAHYSYILAEPGVPPEDTHIQIEKVKATGRLEL